MGGGVSKKIADSNTIFANKRIKRSSPEKCVIICRFSITITIYLQNVLNIWMGCYSPLLYNRPRVYPWKAESETIVDKLYRVWINYYKTPCVCLVHGRTRVYCTTIQSFTRVYETQYSCWHFVNITYNKYNYMLMILSVLEYILYKSIIYFQIFARIYVLTIRVNS